jgi:hypothetical protein
MLRAVLILLVACGGGSSPGNDTTLVGECEPAEDATELSVTPITIDSSSHCLERDTSITIVESVAQWDELFAGCNRPEIPAGLDLATQRAAIAVVSCQPIDMRFTSETAAEIVVGVMTRVSGACLANLIVVPLERSTKPVRLAQCREDCPSCPPVP